MNVCLTHETLPTRNILNVLIKNTSIANILIVSVILKHPISWLNTVELIFVTGKKKWFIENNNKFKIQAMARWAS